MFTGTLLLDVLLPADSRSLKAKRGYIRPVVTALQRLDVAAAEVGAGMTPTWPLYGRRSLVLPRITLDHVLVPDGVNVRGFTAVTVPRTDHRAIIATLTVSS